MYNDQKTAKDRLTKKTKITGVFGKRAGAIKKKINCVCKEGKCKC